MRRYSEQSFDDEMTAPLVFSTHTLTKLVSHKEPLKTTRNEGDDEYK